MGREARERKNSTGTHGALHFNGPAVRKGDALRKGPLGAPRVRCKDLVQIVDGVADVPQLVARVQRNLFARQHRLAFLEEVFSPRALAGGKAPLRRSHFLCVAERTKETLYANNCTECGCIQ
jgi:hypothetical protein